MTQCQSPTSLKRSEVSHEGRGALAYGSMPVSNTEREEKEEMVRQGRRESEKEREYFIVYRINKLGAAKH